MTLCLSTSKKSNTKEYFWIHLHIAPLDYGLEYMGGPPQTREIIKDIEYKCWGPFSGLCHHLLKIWSTENKF